MYRRIESAAIAAAGLRDREPRAAVAGPDARRLPTNHSSDTGRHDSRSVPGRLRRDQSADEGRRRKTFYWPAIAGVWKPHIGGGTPRDFGPCGDVLDCGAPLLFRHFERRYPYLRPVAPLVEECLLVPFYVEGKAVGTIWAIAHDEHRRFDAEDLRQLQNLSRFASAAFQVMETLTASEQREEALRHSNAELALAERALREADRRKDIFVATVAHELRQPIAAMLPAVTLIGERASEQSGKRARAVIERQITHLGRMVDDLLDVARIAEGKLDLQRGLIDGRDADSGRDIQHIIVIRRASSQVIRIAAG